ncbi:AraC family transcriptional regulator [Mucilaginibacter sp. PPCGB 2223]|nr:AraC family transcriptional regulator [Mucilaginibacter sp. PPCGB 2223]
MYLRIETPAPKTLIGMSMPMSFANIQTPALWRSFMPRLGEVKNRVGANRYSAEVYPPGYYNNFNPANTFDKWAAVEVSAVSDIPAGMQTLPFEGQYAVFLHTGPASLGAKTYNYIFLNWLPASGYMLDDRPHFAVMGDKYKGEDAASEEEIWIPVRAK